MTELYPTLVANDTITLEELKGFRSGDYPLKWVSELSTEKLSWPAIDATDGTYFEDSEDLAWSLREHGVCEPLEAVHENGVARLLDGHHRALTLIEMGWDKPIPVYWYCHMGECHSQPVGNPKEES